MFRLDNRTDWSAGLYPGWGRNLQRQETLVFKAGFTFDGEGKLSPLPRPPIEVSDRYRGDPETSSLIAANETVPFKKGGELLLYGSAHPASPGDPVLQVKVALRQGNDEFWSKELRGFGPRAWKRRLFMAIPGVPKAIEKPLPLAYENAYGGFDPRNPEACFRANPAGVGFSLRGFRTKGLTLPQVECGPHFITGPASRVAPAGFGPLAPHWEPRRQTKPSRNRQAYDLSGCPWNEEPPECLYNAAPPDQRFDRPFAREMALQLKGLMADTPHDILINLPEIRPRIHMQWKGQASELTAACDTLIVHTDQKQILLVCRCALPWSPSQNDEGLVILRDLAAEEKAKCDQAETTP